ncbi:MAG: hypothetical protein IPH20_05445 [Bacteroidales bacterium]|nr:hypothetical protein [Bacteroidales bacterium]
MSKSKLFLSLLLFSVIITSCELQGESHEKYTSYVSITETTLPDSVVIGQTVPVYAKAMAPNGCWSDLTIFLGKSVLSDTIYAISATGLFESYNGICSEILITADTTFEFKPDTVGTFIFASYSALLVPSYDTLVVSDTADRKSPVKK